MNYALTVYPLSSGLRSRLHEVLKSDPVSLSLAELRRVPMIQAIGRLRRLHGARLIVQLEDQNSRRILPMLKAVAALSNASIVEIRDESLDAARISRWKLRLGLLSMGIASAVGARDALLCARDLAALLTARRIDAPLKDTPDTVYLNANLWFGVKAGGSLGHVAGVVNALHDEALRVVYASPGGESMIRPEVHLLELAPPREFGLPYEFNYYAFHRMVVRQLAELAPPGFIYQRMSIANFAGVMLSRRWNVPLVLEYNGSEVWVAKNWGLPLSYPDLAARAEEACLRHAHLVVTISEVLRDELIERGVSPERIVCYPNCIDPMVFDPARFTASDSLALRRRLGIAPQAVVATFIGTFGQWHGADVLAQAIRQLVDNHRAWLTQTNLHFLLVGDGVKMSVIRNILAGDEYAPFFTLTGLVPQQEAPSYLAASDVLLSPHLANADGTRFFGSPTKLFEYMAMGKAIVASDLEQIGKVLQDSLRVGSLPAGEPGVHATALAVLVPPGDVIALVDAIKFAAGRPSWRAVLGANARAEALSKYTWKHHVEAILSAVHSFDGPPQLASGR